MGAISPDYLVQDGVIPRSRLPEVLEKINEISREFGLRIANIFHAGDGNLHPLVLFDARIPGETEKALEAFVWGARGQFFWDGNKRTSMTLANKILISSGVGFLTITDKHMEQFNTLLLDYYNTGDSETLKDFLYENAIQGIY